MRQGYKLGDQVLRHALVGVVDTVTDEGGAADATGVPAAAAGEDGPAESDDNAGTSGE
jgi:molecular chaperone GrpE